MDKIQRARCASVSEYRSHGAGGPFFFWCGVFTNANENSSPDKVERSRKVKDTDNERGGVLFFSKHNAIANLEREIRQQQ